jgi:hypothetical protein
MPKSRAQKEYEREMALQLRQAERFAKLNRLGTESVDGIRIGLGGEMLEAREAGEEMDDPDAFAAVYDEVTLEMLGAGVADDEDDEPCEHGVWGDPDDEYIEEEDLDLCIHGKIL